MFVNRKYELGVLEKRYISEKPELFIIYGRRRVGKTELIRHFIKSRPHIYYLADLRSEREQLEIISTLLGDYFGDNIIKDNPLKNWELVFRYIFSKLTDNEKFILVLDEFQYLAEISPSLPSVIQKVWDGYLKNKNIFLLLCGSSMSFMEKQVLSYKSPLYGRRTGQLEVFQFDFFQLNEMLPKLDTEELINFSAVFGGVPAYLELADQSKSLWKNIEEQIFPQDRILHNEVNFLLMQELRTPKNYFLILRAIALGRTKINDIVQLTGLERGLVGKFLDNLMELRIVERNVPVTENPQNSRKGIYAISDNYFRFWFRFIYPHLTYLAEGKTKYVLDIIKKDFAVFLGSVYEDICLSYLRKDTGIFPFNLIKIGKYWEKKIEIDIVGLDESGENIVIGECKFSNKKIGTNIIEDLKNKSAALQRFAQNFNYILFSKSGFTEDMIKYARAERIQLIDLSFTPYFDKF